MNALRYFETSAESALVLRPSYVPEKGDKNQRCLNKKKILI